MKIQLISDLHLEFGYNVHIPNAGADVLVLAGDICDAKVFKDPTRNFRNLAYYLFFDEVCDKFKHVIYIMGNHEHYKGTFNKTADILRSALSQYKNLHFLDNQSVFIDGVNFVGSTLWANANTEDALAAVKLQFAMNDFRLIKVCDDKGNYRKFSPYDVRREFNVSKLFLEDSLGTAYWNEAPCVVVTHHAPSFKSIADEYKNDIDLNSLYASDLEYLMKDNVKLWCHGHTHTPFDYKIGNTRVVCNPRGYPGEREKVNLELVMEI